MNSNPIATAPEVPSSTNMNYYDARYYSSASATPALYMNPTIQNQSDMNSVASAAAAAAAAAGLPANNSLPPLSHLLPSNNNSNNTNTNSNSNSNNNNHNHNINNNHDAKNNTSDDTMEMSGNDTDYFSPQNKHLETVTVSQPPGAGGGGGGGGSSNEGALVQRSYTSTASVPSHPNNASSYRKSIDYQRSMFPPTSDISRRGYVSSQQNGYYMLPPQQQHLPHYGPPAPSTIVPSSDLSVFPQPSHHHHHHPSNIYHTSRAHGHLYHLPSPPTSVIDGVLVADPNNHQHVVNGGITNNSQKVFSFVPLPGLNQKKRPRRKFHEVERLYQCNFQDCTKSYGTLNHLNAHVSMQRHVS